MRKALSLCLILVLLFSLQLRTLAAGTGSLRVVLKESGKPIMGAKIQLYKAGEPTRGGYILADQFGGGFITQTDVMLPELALWLAEKGSSHISRTTDREGTAHFQDLEEGLYLVRQAEAAGGCGPFEPFLITLPWDGDVWDITASPKTQRLPVSAPDTSDPGTLDRGLLGMTLSGMGLCVLLLGKRKWAV